MVSREQNNTDAGTSVTMEALFSSPLRMNLLDPASPQLASICGLPGSDFRQPICSRLLRAPLAWLLNRVCLARSRKVLP